MGGAGVAAGRSSRLEQNECSVFSSQCFIERQNGTYCTMPASASTAPTTASHTQRVLDLARQKAAARQRPGRHRRAAHCPSPRMTAAGLVERVGVACTACRCLMPSRQAQSSTVHHRGHQGATSRVLPAHGAAVPRADHATPRQVWIAMPRGSHAPRIDLSADQDGPGCR